MQGDEKNEECGGSQQKISQPPNKKQKKDEKQIRSDVQKLKADVKKYREQIDHLQKTVQNQKDYIHQMHLHQMMDMRTIDVFPH